MTRILAPGTRGALTRLFHLSAAVLLAPLTALSLRAQAPASTHHWFVAPEAKVTRLNGDYTALTGGRAGWMVAPSFSVGLAGYVNTSSHIATGYQLPSGSEAGLELAYGGIDLAWNTQPSPRLHVTVGTLLGGGGMGYRGQEGADLPADGFFVAEPGVTAELTVLNNARLGVGASYRAVSGAGLHSVRSADLRGAAASLILKVGSF